MFINFLNKKPVDANVYLFYKLIFTSLIVAILSSLNSYLGIIFLFLIVLLSINKFKFIAYLSILCSGFHGILQLNGLSPISSAIDVVFTIILYMQLMLYLIIKRRVEVMLSNNVYMIIGLLATMTFSVLLSKYNNDYIFLLLYLKDFFIPLTAFFYFYILIREKIIDSEDVIKFLYYGILIVSIFSLLHYMFNITDVFDRYVPRRGLKGDEFGSVRVVMGVSITRMNSLFVLSTQGASSCLYAIGLYLSIFENKFLKIKRIVALLYATIFLLCGIFAVSFSFVLTFIIITLTNAVTSSSVYLKLISVITGSGVLLLASLFLSVDDGNRSVSLIPYAWDGFIRPAIGVLDKMSFGDFIFGFGLIPKLYYNEYLSLDAKNFLSNVIYDNWLLGAFLQVGFLYVLISILLLVFVFHRLNTTKNKSTFLSALIFLSLIGFSHGFFLLDRLFIFKATLLLAIIFNDHVNVKSDTMLKYIKRKFFG